MHAQMWADRLRDEPRFETPWTSSGRTRSASSRRSSALRSRSASSPRLQVDAGRARRALRRAARALGGDDDGAPLASRVRRGDRRPQVWEALAEIPDPEIPVISLVELGVVTRRRRSTADNVRVEFTPTFLGCPALEVMRDAMAEQGARARRRAATSTSSRTTRGRPTRSRRRAARSCARRASPRRRRATAQPPTARPARSRRLPLPVLRLDRHEAREPLRPDAVPLACATATRCRQPFEQFKTI